MSDFVLCRTCARPAPRLLPLFTHPERHKRFSLALKIATGLQIEMNDGLPQHICTECSQSVSRVLKFRTISQNAETRLFEIGFVRNNFANHVSDPQSTAANKPIVIQIDLDAVNLLKSPVCRTCAQPTACLQPLFSCPERYKRFSLALNLATGLQIEMNDGLPQHICTECSQSVSRVLKFRTNSQNAETRLLELGFLKINMYSHPSDSKSRADKGLVIQEGHLYPDVRLYKKDQDEEELSSFVKVENSSNIAINFFSEDERMRLEKELDCQTNAMPIVEATLNKMQWRLDQFLDASAPLFTCKECKKIYKNKASFSAHTMAHTGMEFMCDNCGKAFWSKMRLLRHQRSIHGAARDVRLRCQLCDYHALDRKNLNVHIRKHTGERPFTCDKCSASFADKALLAQHRSVHITERNILCEECPAKFRSRHDLNVHRHRSHKPRRWRYQCVYCSKVFVKSTACRKHMHKYHGVPPDQQERNIRVPNDLKPEKEVAD